MTVITRKMMALTAVPVAAVLAGGGAAVAHAAGTPAGTAVVQQASVHHRGDGCNGHQVTAATPVTKAATRRDGDHRNGEDHGTCGHEHAGHAQAVRAGSGVTARAHCGGGHGDE